MPASMDFAYQQALEKLRTEIDFVDTQILALINQRLQLCAQVGALKSLAGGQVRDAAREQALISRLQSENPGPLPDVALASLWTELFTVSRAMQQALLDAAPSKKVS